MARNQPSPRPQASQRADLGQRDWYDDPLSYDIVHSPGTAAEVRGLERIERRFSRVAPRASPSVWFEPACGTGRYLRAAAKRGKRVIGIDLNPRMVAFARRALRDEGLKGTVRVADMTRAPAWMSEPSADFAFCLINSIRHLPSDRSMLEHLRAVRRLVKPGGLYCVGIGLTHYGAEFPTEAVFTATRAGVHVTQVAQFLVPIRRSEPVLNHLTVETRQPHGGRRTGGWSATHFDNSYRLRCYSGAQWTAIVERAGWEIAGVVDEQGNDAPAFAHGEYRRHDISCYGLFVLRRPSVNAPTRNQSKQAPHHSRNRGTPSRPRASQRPR